MREFVFWGEGPGGLLDGSELPGLIARLRVQSNGHSGNGANGPGQGAPHSPGTPETAFGPTAHVRRLVAQLPTVADKPLPSPELLQDMPAGDVHLEGWHLEGYAVPLERVLPALAALPDEGLGTDLRVGADLRFWRKAAQFVLELTVKQHVVPGIEREDTRIRSRWFPVLVPEQERINILARSMPPACRAIVGRPEEATPPRDLVVDFVSEATNRYIRLLVAGVPYPPGNTVWDRWVATLASQDPTLRGAVREIGELAESLTEWQAPIHAAMPPFRTAFELTSPEREEGAWVLRFGFQAPDDPDLFVPAAEIWKAASARATFYDRRIDHPQEKFLADLGKAARVFPPLMLGLRSARPEGAELNAQDAWEFLRNATPALEDSGFGVIVPSWWARGAARIGVRLTVRPIGQPVRTGTGTLLPSEAAAGLDTQVAYDWQLALGNQPLTRQEYHHLSHSPAPLVMVRGEWVELTRPQLDGTVRYWERRPGGKRIPLAEAMRLALTGGAVEQGLPVTSVVGQGWLADLLGGQGQPRIPELPTPQGFVGELRPYQVRGFSWLAFLTGQGLGACLADDMGLGKTIQFIALLLHNKRLRARRRPVLLICPTSVVGNWRREVQKFAPEALLYVHHGPDRLEGEAFMNMADNVDMVITTYSLAARDVEELSGYFWDGIVLDEAQNIRNSQTQQSKAVKNFKARYRVALTGTPVENRLGDLWSIFDFLNPEYLGTLAEFRQRYALPIERWRDSVASLRLRKLVGPFVLRRLKTDPFVIRDLPEKLEMKVYCTLTREQARLYKQVLNQMLDEIEASQGIARHGAVIKTLTKLKQVCNHPAHYLSEPGPLAGRSGKLARITEMLEEAISEGDRALVFTQFVEMGNKLKDFLREQLETEVIFLHGGVPASQRDKMVLRFQEEADGPKVFILSLKAGGFGLNLTRANHVFHFDRWWNPAVENQATDRAFRIGQTRNVQVHKFVCVGTLEERIDHMIESKKAIAANVVSAGEGWLSDLSTNELRDILALREDAVEDD
ncbi:MAG: DEAD/DEAH box helicase [Candidatus Sericytochromatia bacterium]|nr:DEAD/DEAH box helicase [Candidatus Tanganyikabacteria bacterium]